MIERNFSCRVGEIDLICRDGHTLVFVEVRYRSNPRFASAGASVTATKQKKLIRAAQVYLQRINGVNSERCRFDVVAIQPGQSDLDVQWLRSAFTA